MNIDSCDVLIAGTGVAGLCCALNLPRSWRVVMLTKSEADKSDSFLAQGGICMLRGQDDFAGYFEDTMRAGHYENDEAAVRQMILRSPAMIDELIGCGVLFARDKEGGFRFTREGGHSRPRILFHDDVTGKEITSKLLAKVRQLPNVEIREYAELLKAPAGAASSAAKTGAFAPFIPAIRCLPPAAWGDCSNIPPTTAT